MNIEIIKLYKQLTVEMRQHLLEISNNSPKMGIFWQILDTQNFKNTNKAIAQIYAQEILEKVDKDLLLNRFYKLREKAKSLILDCFKNGHISFSAPEKELKFISFLISNKQFKEAKEHLLVLEKKYWEENIFELLPEVYRKFLKIEVNCMPIDNSKIQAYFEKRNIALRLREDLEFFLDSTYMSCIKGEKYYFLKMLKMLKKLENYPRFKLIYYYMSLRSAVISDAKNNTATSATKRYFNNFFKLLGQNLKIPVLNVLEDSSAIITRLLELELSFWCTSNNVFQIKQVLARILEHHNYCEDAPESRLLNLCQNTLRANFFEYAHIFIHKLKVFQDIQYNHHKPAIYWKYFELEWYCKQYPSVKPPNIIEYMEVFLAEIEERFAADECQVAIAILGVLIIYAIVCGYLEFADELFKKPIWKLYKQTTLAAEDIVVLFELVKTSDWTNLAVFYSQKSAQSKEKGLSYSLQSYFKILADASKIILKIKKKPILLN